MQVDYDINDSVALTSITSFRSLARDEIGDVDYTSAALIDSTAGNFTKTDIDTLTQELRFAGSTETMDWMVGAYFFDEDVKQDTGILYGPAFRAYADIITGGVPGASVLNTIEGGLGLPAGTFFGAQQGLLETASLDNQAFSLFAQLDIDLGDRATLTLGANYTEDEKDAAVSAAASDVFSSVDLVPVGEAFIFAGLEAADPGNPANGPIAAALSTIECSATNPPPACNQLLGLRPFQFLPPFLAYPNSVEPGTSKDDDVTYTVRLAFDVSDNVNMYVGASTGFKASSWNLSRDSRPLESDIAALTAEGLITPNLTTGTRFAEPEEATVYEIGLKAGFDTVAINVAIFDQEIENFQSNIFTGTGFSLANAGKQSTTGAEFDIRWAPTDNFQGTLAATILDPKYDSFTGASGVDGPTDLSGTQPPGIHELSINVGGRYTFEMGNASGFVRAEYIYEDEVQVIENVPADIASREIGTVNASVGLAWENGFEAMLWGRNINNDEYLLSAFPSVAQGGSYSGYPNQPRTYGLTVRKYFD